MFNQTEIATTVLDCWAMYLSALKKNQVAANPSKRVRVHLFGTSHCVSQLIFLLLITIKLDVGNIQNNNFFVYLVLVLALRLHTP